MKKILASLTVASALCIASIPAAAQWSVFDPTNWAQNYAQASAAIKTEITTSKQLYEQVQMAINMAKSVKGLKNLDSLTDLQKAQWLYGQLKNVDGLIDKDFQDALAVGERLTGHYGASNFSWSEFVNSRDRLNKKQRENAVKRYSSINASLEQNAKQRQAIVEQLATVQGQTEAMQAVGAAVDVLIGQNQQLISILATNNRVVETKATQDENTNTAADLTYNAHQKRLREAAAKYRQ